MRKQTQTNLRATLVRLALITAGILTLLNIMIVVFSSPEVVRAQVPSTSTATVTSIPETATSTSTATVTSIPETATSTSTATVTPVPETATSTSTATVTSIPETATSTSTATVTPVPETATSTSTATITPVPTAQSQVDLDIRNFKVTSKIDLKKVKPIKIRLEVKNNSLVTGYGIATVIGVQNGVEIYRTSKIVSDPVGGGFSSFFFPSYSPTLSTKIVWKVILIDGNSDIDVRMSSTSVTNHYEDNDDDQHNNHGH